MNEQWVTTTLAPHVFDGPRGKAIRLDEHFSTDVTDFASMFANATTPVTSASLHAIDAGKLGFGQYIDQWKSEALIG